MREARSIAQVAQPTTTGSHWSEDHRKLIQLAISKTGGGVGDSLGCLCDGLPRDQVEWAVVLTDQEMQWMVGMVKAQAKSTARDRPTIRVLHLLRLDVTYTFCC